MTQDRLTPKAAEALAAESFANLGYTSTEDGVWTRPDNAVPGGLINLSWGVNRPPGKPATMQCALLLLISARHLEILSSLKTIEALYNQFPWTFPGALVYSTAPVAGTGAKAKYQVPMGSRDDFHETFTRTAESFPETARQKVASLTAIRNTMFSTRVRGNRLHSDVVRSGLTLIASTGETNFYDDTVQAYRDYGTHGHWLRDETEESFADFLGFLGGISDQTWKEFRGDWAPPLA